MEENAIKAKYFFFPIFLVILELWNMDNNDDFYGKEFNLTCLYMHKYQFWTKIPQNSYSDQVSWDKPKLNLY